MLTMENRVKPFTDKMYNLLSLLQLTRQEFELVSEEMNDDPVRLTLRGFAIETNQYEQELKSQLNMLEIKETTAVSFIKYDELLRSIHSIVNAGSLKEILNTCMATECFFEKAYRNVLNEYFPYQSLRDVLVYQLNGIKCSFMKLKLLNTFQ